MSDLKFDIENISRPEINEEKEAGIILYIIKIGLVKNKRQAEIFLIIILLISVIICISIFSKSGGRKIKLNEDELKYVNSKDKSKIQQYDYIINSHETEK